MSAELRIRFLDRSEVIEICRCSDIEIRRALRVERKLATILLMVDSGEMAAV